MRLALVLALILAGCGSGEEPPPEGAVSQQAPVPPPVTKPEPPTREIIVVRPWPYVNPQPIIIQPNP